MTRASAFRALDVLARVGLGALFVYAAWSKIRDPAAFARTVANYRMLPSCAVGLVAITLPMTELLAGLALVFTKWSREAALLVLGMMLVFLAGLTQAAVRGLDISCGCFGDDGARGLAALVRTILRDLLLLVPTVWVLVRPGGWLFGRGTDGRDAVTP